MLKAAQTHALRAHLKRGGLVAYPSESVWGIGCLPSNVKSLKRLISLKKRPAHKGFIVVAANESQAARFAHIPHAFTQKVQEQAAPTTYLLPVKNRAHPLLRGQGRRKIAIRVSLWPPLQRLCLQLNSAIVSTSCNRSGRKAATQRREVQKQFGRDLKVIHARNGKHKTPSQLIDWRSGQKLR